MPIIFVMQIKTFRGLGFFQEANYKCADQTAWVRRMVCAFVFAWNEVRFSRDVTQKSRDNARRCPFENYAGNGCPFEQAHKIMVLMV